MFTTLKMNPIGTRITPLILSIGPNLTKLKIPNIQPKHIPKLAKFIPNQMIKQLKETTHKKIHTNEVDQTTLIRWLYFNY